MKAWKWARGVLGRQPLALDPVEILLLQVLHVPFGSGDLLALP